MNKEFFNEDTEITNRAPSTILPPGKNTFLTEVKIVNANTKFIRDIAQQQVGEHTGTI